VFTNWPAIADFDTGADCPDSTADCLRAAVSGTRWAAPTS
jgi:hypothetical protein